MMLGVCGKSLMSITFLSVKLNRMVESASQWICLNLSSPKPRRTVASGLVPHSVPIPGSSSTNPRSNKESRINLSSGAKAEIRNMDPRFTTGTCKTLLSAVGVWVDNKSMLFDEVFDFDYEGTTSHTMSVNVSQTVLTNW